MQLQRLDEAIPWLEKAKTAARYDPRHFPYLNLGRIYAAKGMIQKALEEFRGALDYNPQDPMALQAIDERARKAHAFVQTPEFVARFICQQTIGRPDSAKWIEDPLEGDPRFFFDDSQTPQAYGTGTEEWGGGGDYWGGLNMTLPFAGHPVGVRRAQDAIAPEDKIHSAYRFLLADLMPFGRNAVIRLEHGGTNLSTEHYETVAYWYGRDVLDVGPGTGFYMDRWLRLGANVVGLDFAEVALQGLAARFPGARARFLQADISQPLDALPLRPASFHAVSAFDVLFHITDDAGYALALRNIASLLRPNGWFLWSDNFVRHEAERVEHQVHRPLPLTLRLLEAAGLEPVARVPMFVLMNYPADTKRAVCRWAWTAMAAPALLAEPLGWLLGAALYPLERVLVRRVRESPTTELMICRKR